MELGLGLLGFFVGAALAWGFRGRRRRSAVPALTDQRLAFALEGTSDGIWDWSPRSGETYFSPRWATMLGYAPEEVPQTFSSWTQRVHPEDMPLVMEKLTDHLEGRTLAFEAEHRMRCKDGSWRWILNRAKVFERDSSGRPLRVVGANTDIERTKRAESLLGDQQIRLVSSAKMASLGEMAGGIAHEINNPLGVISALAQKIRMQADRNQLQPQALAADMDVIDQTVLRIAAIIRGLRSFARDTEGDPRGEVQIGTLIKDTLAFCGERFRNHGIQLRVVLPDPTLRFWGKAVELSQVLLNLLNNAFDATLTAGGETRWVEIEVRQEGNQVVLSVSDNGHGIPSGLREEIMKPFFTTKPVGQGTGLGLSISQSIVQSHSGTLRLDPDAPHTRFVVQLPQDPRLAEVRMESDKLRRAA